MDCPHPANVTNSEPVLVDIHMFGHVGDQPEVFRELAYGRIPPSCSESRSGPLGIDSGSSTVEPISDSALSQQRPKVEYKRRAGLSETGLELFYNRIGFEAKARLGCPYIGILAGWEE